MQNTKLKTALYIIFVVLLTGIALIGLYDYLIPDSISVLQGNDPIEKIDLPFISASLEPLPAISRVSQADEAKPFYVSSSAEVKVFGVIPLKKVNVTDFKDVTLYPGGMPFGVKLYTDGVVVAGISGVDTDKGRVSPAADGGLFSA